MECKVCSYPHAGLHYRTICCRACAAFYKRTVFNKLKYECSREENCDITNINRYSCRFCRMKKCVAVGMVLPEKPSTSLHLNADTTEEDSDEPNDVEELYRLDRSQYDPDNFIDMMQRRLNTILDKKYQKRSPYIISLCEQFAAARAEFGRKWPNCTKETMYQTDNIDFAKGMRDFYKAMITTAEFCMDIQPFAELPLEEKPLIFKHFEHRFMNIMRAFTTVEFLGRDVNDTRFVGMGGQVVDFCKSNLKMGKVSSWSGERWKSFIVDSEQKIDMIFIRPFKRYQIDKFEMDFLLGFSMWTLDDVKGLSEETIIKSRKIRERLAEELVFYYKYEQEIQKYSTRIYKLFSLLASLDRVSEIRREESYITRTFKMLNVVHLDEITADTNSSASNC